MTNNFTLPEKWCIKVTKENAIIIGEFYAEHAWKGYKESIPNYHIGRYFTSHNLASNVSIFDKPPGFNFSLEYPTSPFVEITFEQFKNYVLKKETMKRPQTFKITGSKPLLKAIWEELIEMGYTKGRYIPTNNYKELNHICSNYEIFNDTHTIKEFKELYLGKASIDTDVAFNLPEQYNEALQFAKDQLNHPYWNKDGYYNFGAETTINTSLIDIPLFIASGLAKKEDVYKVLLISKKYDIEVIENYNNEDRIGLKFKKKY